MCGRYALHSNEAEIVTHFGLRHGFSMRSRYNIAPTQTIPIICSPSQPIQFSQWGYIPSWAKVLPNTAHINARVESIEEKPTFKEAFIKRRCLIPASGYYEWKTFSGKKQPYYVFLKDNPLVAFGGIFSFWRTPEGEEILTCAILTCNAPSFLEKLHARMPMIIPPQKYADWLSVKNITDPETFQISLKEAHIGVHAVTKRMGHPLFEGSECITPL